MKVGLVGCGKWGKHILRDLTDLGCEVPVVTSSGRVSDFQGVDGIVVATPTTTHADITEQALAHGVPVFVEKPLAADPEEAARIVEAAPDRVFVMDKWRYHPGVELLAEIARSGELGRVVGLRTTRIGWGNPHDVDAVWILAPHDLSIALEIFGSVPSPRSAVALSLDGEAEGLIGLLGDSPWHALEVSARSVERRREVALVCERGVAVLPHGYSGHVLLATDEEPEKRAISTELPLLRELRAFVEHLDGGPPPRSSAQEGAEVVTTIAELRRLAGLPG